MELQHQLVTLDIWIFWPVLVSICLSEDLLPSEK